MKKSIVIVLLCLATVATAKTDIFGEDRQASVYFGEDTLVAEFGFTPLEELDWGLRVQAAYSEDTLTEDHLKVDDWFVGVGVKYPFLDFGSVFPAIPIEGSTFAGVSLLYQVQSNSDLFVVPELGVDIEVTKNISGRVVWQYTQREELFGDKSKLLAGVCVRW